MTNKEIFLKYINGLRCTREEYLKSASDDIKGLYDSCMEYIVRSLIEYTSKDLSSKNSKRK